MTRSTPMEGLAARLRHQAALCVASGLHEDARDLSRWASEIEAAQAAMGEPVAWATEESPPRVASAETKGCMPSVSRASFCVPLYTHPAPKPEAEEVTNAARDVLAERQRQVEAEGWSASHDDHHIGDDLAQAAAAFHIDPTYVSHIRLGKARRDYTNPFIALGA